MEILLSNTFVTLAPGERLFLVLFGFGVILVSGLFSWFVSMDAKDTVKAISGQLSALRSNTSGYIGNINNKIAQKEKLFNNVINELDGKINISNSKISKLEVDVSNQSAMIDYLAGKLDELKVSNRKQVTIPLEESWNKLFIEQNEKANTQFVLHRQAFTSNDEINKRLDEDSGTAKMVKVEGNTTVYLNHPKKSDGWYWKYATLTIEHPIKVKALDNIGTAERPVYKEVDIDVA